MNILWTLCTKCGKLCGLTVSENHQLNRICDAFEHMPCSKLDRGMFQSEVTSIYVQ